MMASSCNKECTPDIKFDCKVNIKSIQEDEFLVRCVGSLISCYSPN